MNKQKLVELGLRDSLIEILELQEKIEEAKVAFGAEKPQEETHCAVCEGMTSPNGREFTRIRREYDKQFDNIETPYLCKLHSKAYWKTIEPFINKIKNLRSEEE